MNNIQKIILGLACLSFANAYAFTPSESNCEAYINNTMVPLNSNYFSSNQANIQACLQACPNLYGNSSDSLTFTKIARCRKNLSTLNFIGENYLQNPQYTNNSGNNEAMQMNSPMPTQVAKPVAAPVTPVSPIVTPTPQNSGEKSDQQQIKWF